MKLLPYDNVGNKEWSCPLNLDRWCYKQMVSQISLINYSPVNKISANLNDFGGILCKRNKWIRMTKQQSQNQVLTNLRIATIISNGRVLNSSNRGAIIWSSSFWSSWTTYFLDTSSCSKDTAPHLIMLSVTLFLVTNDANTKENNRF